MFTHITTLLYITDCTCICSQAAQTLTTHALLHAITYHKQVPQLWLLPDRCTVYTYCHNNGCCGADVWSRCSTLDDW